MPGNSDAVWPSGPRPRCTRSIGGAARDERVVGQRGGLGGVAGAGHRVDRARPDGSSRTRAPCPRWSRGRRRGRTARRRTTRRCPTSRASRVARAPRSASLGGAAARQGDRRRRRLDHDVGERAGDVVDDPDLSVHGAHDTDLGAILIPATMDRERPVEVYEAARRGLARRTGRRALLDEARRARGAASPDGRGRRRPRVRRRAAPADLARPAVALDAAFAMAAPGPRGRARRAGRSRPTSRPCRSGAARSAARWAHGPATCTSGRAPARWRWPSCTARSRSVRRRTCQCSPARRAASCADDDFPGRYFAAWAPDALRDVVVGAGFDVDVVARRRRGVDRRRGDRAPARCPTPSGPGMRLLVCGLNPRCTRPTPGSASPVPATASGPRRSPPGSSRATATRAPRSRRRHRHDRPREARDVRAPRS